MAGELEALIAKADAASREDRITFRDPIAAHGARAIEAIAPWLLDPERGAFAVRVLGKIADLGYCTEAVDALRMAQAQNPSDLVRRDIDAEVNRLDPRSSRTLAPHRGAGKASPTYSPDELVVGKVYARRRDLHKYGLGGNWQKGISYPADGAYVLVFSDPVKGAEHGYKDTSVGSDQYRYFGEWDGTGDMTMTGGNAAIRDRSPEIHLFIAATGGYRYEGRFRFEGYDIEATVRDGRQFNAIVFRLARVLG